MMNRFVFYRKTFFFCVLSFCFLMSFSWAKAGTVYQSTNAQGNVSFSDVPSQDAQTVQVPSLPSSEQSVPPVTTTPTTPQTPPETPVDVYKVFQLIQASDVDAQTQALNPEEIAYIHQSLGNFNVALLISPKIQPDNTLEILLDNVVAFTSPTASTFTLDTPLDPGQHTLSARIVDKEGKVLKESNQLGMFMHRAAGASAK